MRPSPDHAAAVAVKGGLCILAAAKGGPRILAAAKGGPRILAAVLMASLVTAGCAGGRKSTQPAEDLATELVEAPDWVRSNCKSYWDDGGASKICGVGSFRGTRNIALARTTAVARGRTEIARTLETTIEAMLEDRQSTTDDGEQEVEVVSRQITDFTLSGSEMQDTWISNFGTLYALVALDVAKFQDSLSQMDDLPDTLRQTVHERAPHAFAEPDSPIAP